jgi:hypothetical protein
MKMPFQRCAFPCRPVLQLWTALMIGLALAATARADSPLSALKTIRVLPRTESEIATAHEQSRGQACEHLAAGEALEITSFYPEFVGDRLSKRDLPVPTSRRAIFTVGTEMADEDRADLPTLTKGKILEYLGAHYVCIEVRVQRDLDSGELYLHHRPLAATATFSGSRLTKEFTDMVSDSVQNMRSLGLLVPAGAKQTARSYRTLVLVHKSMMGTTQTRRASERAKPIYELIFVHGRPTGKGIELHAFATSQQRRLLCYLRPFTYPKRTEDCGIRGKIRFTKYVASLLPTESVTRGTTARAQANFSIETLNGFAASEGWSGGAYDHIPQILDAIIDHRIPSEAN